MTIDPAALGIMGTLLGALAGAVGIMFRDILHARDQLAERLAKVEEELDGEREAMTALQKKVLDDQKELTKYWGAIAAVLDRQQGAKLLGPGDR